MMSMELQHIGARGVCVAPNGWDIHPLKYVSYSNRYVLPEATPADYTFRYVDIGAVNETQGIYEYKEMSFEEAPSRARRLVSKGDTIISTVRTYLKAIAYIDDAENVVVSTGFCVQTPRDFIYPKFLFYYCISEGFIADVNKFSTGVSYPAISDALLGKTLVLCPPIEEQAAIADYLDRECAKLNEIIETIEKQIEVLQKQKRSVISRAVIKGISRDVVMKDSGISWLGHIPSHWRINRLKYCCSVKTGPFGTQLSADEYTETGTPIVNIKNIGYGNIIDEDLDYIPDEVKKRLSVHILQAGDIVFGRKGAVDKHAIIDERHEGWVQGSDCMRLRIYGDIIPEFLNYYFGSSGYSYYVLSSSVGSTMASVNSQILNDSIVVYPEIDEQRRIVQYLDLAMGRIDAILERKKAQLLALRNYKRTVIYEYVTGKKRVKEVQQDAHQS